MSSPDISNLPPNQTQPPTEPNISPDFNNLPPPNQTKPSTELQLQYPPTTPFNDRTNTCVYTSKPFISTSAPAEKSKPATSLESTNITTPLKLFLMRPLSVKTSLLPLITKMSATTMGF